MNDVELRQLVTTITGYWTASDQRALGIARWIRDAGVPLSQAKMALAALAEQYDSMPSVKQVSVKLAELGTHTKAQVGVGDPQVIHRMKARIMEFAHAAAQRQEITVRDRLRDEQSAIREYHEDAVASGLDEESIAWLRDMLQSYTELLSTGYER